MTSQTLEIDLSIDHRHRRQVPRKLIVGTSLIAGTLFVSLLAQWTTRYGAYQQNVFSLLAPPSAAHWFGTDEVGRDIFSRTVDAIRLDVALGLLMAVAPSAIGTLLGGLSGYFGSWVDVVIGRLADLTQSFPTYILIIVLVFAVGPGFRSIIIGYSVLDWVVYARLFRGEVLRNRELDYVNAARVAGLSNSRILWRHIFPNAIRQVIVYYFSDVVLAILTLAGFSFLGLGIPPPTPELGAMIAAGEPYLSSQWWICTFPGLVLVALGIGLSLIADGLDDVLGHR